MYAFKSLLKDIGVPPPVLWHLNLYCLLLAKAFGQEGNAEDLGSLTFLTGQDSTVNHLSLNKPWLLSVTSTL